MLFLPSSLYSVIGRNYAQLRAHARLSGALRFPMESQHELEGFILFQRLVT